MARKVSAGVLKFFLNLWPPFLGAGIHVRTISPDFRNVRVELALRFYNRNYVGSHYGGSLYSMTDPFFMLMVLHNLSSDYLLWDKAGSIDYVAPGRTRVAAEFTLTQQDIDRIVEATAGGDKHLHVFNTQIVDAEGLVVARVEKIVYVRRKKIQ